MQHDVNAFAIAPRATWALALDERAIFIILHRLALVATGHRIAIGHATLAWICGDRGARRAAGFIGQRKALARGCAK